MQFEWDEAKDAANRVKHGLSLGDIARMDWPPLLLLPDDRRDYGEPRLRAYLLRASRLYVAILTLRDARYRVISLRKANAREERDYGSIDAP